MSGARRRAVQRLLHDPMDRGGRDRRLTSPAGGHLAQPEHALLGEALPPEQDSGPRRLQLCRDCVIRAAFGGEQNDACPEHDALACAVSADPGLQRLALLR